MNPTVIGLTGPTGSGKSVLADCFLNAGFFIIGADKIARETVMPGTKTLRNLTDAFGRDILNKNGSLNRAALAKKAFSSREKTDLLNAITHPAVLSEIKRQIDESQTEFILIDAPQLFESGCEKICDGVISVWADDSHRLARILSRDGISKEDARRRMRAGLKKEDYKLKSDYMLYNNEDLSAFRAASSALAEKIRKAVSP